MNKCKKVFQVFILLLFSFSLVGCIDAPEELSFSLKGYDNEITTDVSISDYVLLSETKEELKALITSTSESILLEDLVIEYYEEDILITDFNTLIKNDTTYKIIISTLKDTTITISIDVSLQYRVSFYDNDEVLIEEQFVLEGESAILPELDNLNGYVAEWSEETSTITEHLDVYLSYNPSETTITFSTNNGTNITAITQDIDSPLTKPSDPTRDGYTFSGWFIDESLGDEYVFPLLMPYNSMTLYAKWAPIMNTITFNEFDGSNVTDISQLTDSSLIKPTNPIKNGYTFSGWFVDGLLTDEFDFPNIMPPNSITLYAKWDEVIVEPGYDRSDELLLSIDRISNIDFELDFDTMFANEQETQQQSTRFSMKPATRLFSDYGTAPIVLDDCTIHPLYSGVCYNSRVFDYPDEIDGLLSLDTFLDSKTSTRLKGYEESFYRRTSDAKEIVEWAIDNITLMNTWVLKNMGSNRRIYYLLDYDEVNDVVNLLTKYYGNEESDLEFTRKLSIYYNELGEEVVEYYSTAYQTSPNISHSNSYFIMVDSKDFNSSSYYYDPNGEFWNEHYVGLNEKDDGTYEYFSIFKPLHNDYPYFSHFDQYITSGDYGWYIVDPIDYITVWDYSFRPENMSITVASPNALNDVFKIQKVDDVYEIELNLPAFNGLNRIVFEEIALSQNPIHSSEQRQEIIDKGLIPLDEYYTKYNSMPGQYIEGFDTDSGRFLNTDTPYNGVNLTHTYVRKDWDNNPPFDKSYHAYHTKLYMTIDAVSMDDAFIKLEDYLAYTGLTYKYGDLNDLFTELKDFNQELPSILDDSNVLENIDSTLPPIYSSLENYIIITDYMLDLARQLENNEITIVEDEVILLEDLPDKADIDYIDLYDINDMVTGTVTIDSNGIDVSNLEYTVIKKPILTPDREYSIYYSFSRGNKSFIIDSISGQIYQRQHLLYTPTDKFTLLKDLPEGTFILTHFLGKKTEDGVIQVSNNAPVISADFEMFTMEYNSIYEGQRWFYTYAEYEGHLYLDVALRDIQSPTIKLFGVPEIITEDSTYTLYPVKFTEVSEIQGFIENIYDNVDDSDHLIVEYYNEDNLITDFTENFIDNTNYKIKIIDTSGNAITITFMIDYLNQVTFFDSFGEVIEQHNVFDGVDVIPPVRAKDGYTIEWSTTTTNVNSDLNVTEILIPTENIITFEVNDGSAVSAIVQDTDTILTQPQDPSRDGYTFGGWFTDEILVDGYIFPELMPTNSFTLYAKWTANENTITFEVNDGSTVSAIVQDTDTILTQPEDPSRDGYTFGGWFTDELLVDGYIFPEFMPTNSFTLYAKWDVETP